MKKLLTGVAVATLAAMVLATPSPGTHTARDFAAGAGKAGGDKFAFAAYQTDGFFAQGGMAYKTPTQKVKADVICLGVVGNMAFIIGNITKSSGDPTTASRIAFEVTDGGRRGQGDRFSAFFASEGLGCRLPPFGGATPLTSGDILVRDQTP